MEIQRTQFMSKNLEQRIEVLEKLVESLQAKIDAKIGKKLGIGDTFDLVGAKWKILDITDKGYLCLAEKLPEKMQFDSICNNWQVSDLRDYLNTEFLDKLTAEIGADNIIPFERDLLSMDGQTEYDTCEDKVSLLTVDEYRKYRSLIPNTEDYCWWLITPDSTACNNDTRWVRCVSPSGSIDGNDCNFNFGVRPLCIFSSAIFE